MPHPLLASTTEPALPIWLANEESWPGIAESLPAVARSFARAQGFEAKMGTHCLLPDAEGGLFGVVFGLEAPVAKRIDPFLPGKLASLLPEGASALLSLRLILAPCIGLWWLVAGLFAPSPGPRRVLLGAAAVDAVGFGYLLSWLAASSLR